MVDGIGDVRGVDVEDMLHELLYFSGTNYYLGYPIVFPTFLCGQSVKDIKVVLAKDRLVARDTAERVHGKVEILGDYHPVVRLDLQVAIGNDDRDLIRKPVELEAWFEMDDCSVEACFDEFGNVSVQGADAS